jgi:ribosomal protein L35
MPKMKTRKAISQRFKLKKKTRSNGTATYVAIKQQDGKGHFNGKESGKVRRNKRTDNTTATHTKAIRQAMPYQA